MEEVKATKLVSSYSLPDNSVEECCGSRAGWAVPCVCTSSAMCGEAGSVLTCMFTFITHTTQQSIYHAYYYVKSDFINLCNEPNI